MALALGITLTACLEFATQVARAEAERMSLCNKRYDMAQTDADKKAAIDDGLRASDDVTKVKNFINAQMGKLIDAITHGSGDKPDAVTVSVPVQEPGLK